MTNHQFEQQLESQLAQLDKHIEPKRDLWPGIEVALTEQEQSQAPAKSGLKMPLALAASVLMVGVLSWSVIKGGAEPNLSGEELVMELSRQHQQQKQALLVKFQDQPALTENWQTQLTELDEAAVAIKAALEHEPNNMALLKMLQNVHQQQIDLIERVHSSKWQQI